RQATSTLQQALPSIGEAADNLDGWLARQAHKRQVIARANSYSAALKMIAGTDFIVTLPRRVQQLLALEPQFGHCEAPNGLPGFTLDMQWNDVSEQETANAWFREQVVKAVASVKQDAAKEAQI
ncbi:MAG: hypothetical protein RR726_01205, partial [Pseudomonas sp.]